MRKQQLQTTRSKEFIFCLLRPIPEDKKIAREGWVKLFEDEKKNLRIFPEGMEPVTKEGGELMLTQEVIMEGIDSFTTNHNKH